MECFKFWWGSGDAGGGDPPPPSNWNRVNLSSNNNQSNDINWWQSALSGFNSIPTRLCHVIVYCCSDKNYPCLVGIGLSDDQLQSQQNSGPDLSPLIFNQSYLAWIISFLLEFLLFGWVLTFINNITYLEFWCGVGKGGWTKSWTYILVNIFYLFASTENTSKNSWHDFGLDFKHDGIGSW